MSLLHIGWTRRQVHVNSDPSTDVIRVYLQAKINGNTTGTVAGILADAAAQNPVPLVAFIVYDLPNRDCHAKASNGEICCVPNPDGTCDYDSAGDGTCSTGLQDYEQNYITPLATLFGKYPQVPIVAIIEPDSLPNCKEGIDSPYASSVPTQTANLSPLSSGD